ncbi:hypothetical protein BT96DRAFT_919422, partial [Gymnopus androsaceus JB14]
MSDEIAQDEEDAEDYDLESLEHRHRGRDEDEVTLRGDDHGPVADDDVVFEIGDDDENEMTPITAKSSAPARQRSERLSGEEERRGLMARSD